MRCSDGIGGGVSRAYKVTARDATAVPRGCVGREATSAAKEALLMTPANQDLDALQALAWADLPSRQFDYVHQIQRGTAAVGPETLVLLGWRGGTCHIVGDDPLLSSAATLSLNWNPCLKVYGAYLLPTPSVRVACSLYQSCSPNP